MAFATTSTREGGAALAAALPSARSKSRHASLPHEGGAAVLHATTGVQIGCHVKDELSSPPHNPTFDPQSRYDRIDQTTSPLHHDWCGKVVKEEVLSAIAKACSRLLHYLDGRGDHDSSSLRAILSAEERAAREAGAAQRGASLRVRQVRRGHRPSSARSPASRRPGPTTCRSPSWRRKQSGSSASTRRRPDRTAPFPALPSLEGLLQRRR